MKYDLKLFAFGTEEYRQALELRTVILRIPLGLVFTQAELEKDKSDVHIGLFSADEILACLTLTKAEDNKLKMRQVAVKGNVQGQGLGSILTMEAENYARRYGIRSIFCHARKNAVPFYQKNGYKIISDEFTEVNIPHYTMEKLLR